MIHSIHPAVARAQAAEIALAAGRQPQAPPARRTDDPRAEGRFSRLARRR
jgi:hypothetical protein